MQKLVVSVALFFQILIVKAAITELNDENFQTEIEKYEVVLVIFHAPWCGQCKKLMSIISQIDDNLQKNIPPVDIVTVDCEYEAKVICKKYMINRFPMLRSFRNGKEYGKFEGSRDVKNIVNFVRWETAPPARKLENFENLEEILQTENRVCLVASFQKQNELESTFLELAEKLRQKMCFLYINADVNSLRLYQNPILRNKFEKTFVEYDNLNNISSLEHFISSNYHGLVGVRTLTNTDDFKLPLVTAYFKIDYDINPKSTNYWRNRILKVASKYKDNFNFAISSKEDFFSELQNFNVPPQSTPVILVKLESNEKFILKEYFSVEKFDSFLHDVLHKKLNPYLKSQKPPQKQDSDVVVAVGSTFYDLVIRNSNDTMVKVYVDSCVHCKQIAPIYKEIAKMFRDEKITFIKVNYMKNDVPVAYEPVAYPTIYWSTRENRMNPIRYEGNRNIEDFIKFIAKHASIELKDYDRAGNSKVIKTEL
ncbi:hypothetical protein HHI36_007144 [Cryptolaemus montrouzieri]|uniref:protein disulfide-isomerase n=1 Tax=Cryptolaemus montrouzieri TaxID=559131 RepID=A0ABD2MNQ1_9CUCU